MGLRVTKENSRDEHGVLKDGAPDGLSKIHSSAALSDQQPKESTSSKLWDLNMQVQGNQKLSNEWCGECQVVCRDKYTCINKSESKASIETV